MNIDRMEPPQRALTIDFLIWIAAAPRTYADVMDVWRSACPRLTIWEDALLAGLVELDASTAPAQVKLTARGEAMTRPVTDDKDW